MNISDERFEAMVAVITAAKDMVNYEYCYPCDKKPCMSTCMNGCATGLKLKKALEELSKT